MVYKDYSSSLFILFRIIDFWTGVSYTERFTRYDSGGGQG